MSKKIMNAPGWLGLSDDRAAFVYVPERAKIVREIFDMSIAGMGGYSIAKFLNSKNVPAFGSSKRWDQSTIHNMLTSRAVIGEYHKKQIIDGQEVPVGDPVPGYYPAVIDESLFQAAQEARQRNLRVGRGRKGRLVSNLFSRLLECAYCAGPVKFHSNGNAKSLICETVLHGGTCAKFGWYYKEFEESFFALLEQCDQFPELAQTLAELRVHAEHQHMDQLYHSRTELARILRSVILRISVSSAGTEPPKSSPDQKIGRHNPERFFTVDLVDGSSRMGSPIPFKKTTHRKFDAVKLTALLGVSPRQGALIALLVEGEKLATVAQRLGITLETTRWHLREIFMKTATHSQSDLVQLAEALDAEITE